MKFKIIEKPFKHSHYEDLDFRAVKMNNHEIWGAHATLNRMTDIRTGKMGPWKLNYPTVGSGSYEQREPHVAAINAALKRLKEYEALNSTP